MIAIVRVFKMQTKTTISGVSLCPVVQHEMKLKPNVTKFFHGVMNFPSAYPNEAQDNEGKKVSTVMDEYCGCFNVSTVMCDM